MFHLKVQQKFQYDYLAARISLVLSACIVHAILIIRSWKPASAYSNILINTIIVLYSCSSKKKANQNEKKTCNDHTIVANCFLILKGDNYRIKDSHSLLLSLSSQTLQLVHKDHVYVLYICIYVFLSLY